MDSAFRRFKDHKKNSQEGLGARFFIQRMTKINVEFCCCVTKNLSYFRFPLIAENLFPKNEIGLIVKQIPVGTVYRLSPAFR